MNSRVLTSIATTSAVFCLAILPACQPPHPKTGLGLTPSRPDLKLRLIGGGVDTTIAFPEVTTTGPFPDPGRALLDPDVFIPYYEPRVDIWTDFRAGSTSVGGTAVPGKWVRIIESNGIPEHDLEPSFLSPLIYYPGRPHKVKPQEYLFEIPVNDASPLVGASMDIILDQLFGMNIDGVPFDPEVGDFYDPGKPGDHSPMGHKRWQFEAVSGVIDLGFDDHNAHVQKDGEYHYHADPVYTGSYVWMPSDMILIGWAFDGYPIYWRYGYADAMDPQQGMVEMTSSWELRSVREKSEPVAPTPPVAQFELGSFKQDYIYNNTAPAGTLDECNGRYGVTPEFPIGTYHYFITSKFPYVPRCHKGTTTVAGP